MISKTFTCVIDSVGVLNKEDRRKFAGWSIIFTCTGNFFLTYAASSLRLPGLVHQQFMYLLCLLLSFKSWEFSRILSSIFIQTNYRPLRYSLCGIGGLLLLVGLIVLSCVDQDDARHSFGHSGGTDFPKISAQCFVGSILFGYKPENMKFCIVTYNSLVLQASFARLFRFCLLSAFL